MDGYSENLQKEFEERYGAPTHFGGAYVDCHFSQFHFAVGI